MRAHLWPMVFVVGFAAACYPKVGPAPGALSTNGVTYASTQWPGTTAATLTAGHDTFIAKCNGCHDYPDLVAISVDSWPKIVARMGKKADLTTDQSDAVLHYVLAARSEQAGKQAGK